MTCRAIRDRLLEADPAELAGETDSELGRHLARCASCQAVAARILEGERQLGRHLDLLSRRSDQVEAEPDVPGLHRRAARRPVWRVVGPLAAAAAIASVLLWPRGETGLPERAVTPARTAVEAYTFEVEGPPGRNVAVFETDNPEIVVVWFF